MGLEGKVFLIELGIFVKVMRKFFLILSMFLALDALGQSVRFVNYTSADGLPSNTVYAVTQDRDGILWVGTRNGLCSFDGDSFHLYQDELPARRVTSLTVDHGNRLWVGTTGGLCIEIPGGAWRTGKRHFSNIRALHTDRDGFVWATAGDSLLYKLSYNPQDGIKEEACTFYSKRYSEGDYPYYQIFEDTDGTLWLGGRIVRAQFVKDRANPKSQLRLESSNCSGNYAKVNGTLYGFDDHTSELITFQGREIVRHGRLPISHARFLTDSKGRLWAAGTYGVGMVEIGNPGNTKVYKHEAENPFSPSSTELYCIFEDAQGNIWVGGDNGLSVICPAIQQVQPLDLPSTQVTALMEASDGSLWVGTADSGAFALKEGGVTQVDYRPAGRKNEGYVSCLYEDSEGAVYIGLNAGCGFNVWKEGKVKRGAVSGPVPKPQHRVADGDRITSNWIMDFLEGRDGRFWVVTWEGIGLNEWDRRTGKTAPAEWLSPFFYPTPQTDSPSYISSRLGSRLIEDSHGNLVYGTTEAGLNIIDKDTRLVTKYLHNPSDSLSLPDNYVTDLCLAPDGTLWAATRGGLWSPTRGRRLGGTLIQSVKADDKGRIWAGTENGLYFMDTDGSIGVAHTGLGFPSDIYGEKVACKLSDGRLAFGGLSGAAVFHPDSLLAISSERNLPLGQLAKHRYRINRGPWMNGRFAGLPDNTASGRYIIEEETSDVFGRWEHGSSALSEIRVPLPLLLRWPFLLLYALSLAAGVWLFIRLRERRLRAANDRLEAAVSGMFTVISHDLKGPVSGIRRLSEELAKRYDSLTPEQLGQALTQLGGAAKVTSAMLENLLMWSLSQKNVLTPAMKQEPLADIVNDAAQDVWEAAAAKNVTLMVPPFTRWITTDRNMLTICLRNLLENAVKYSPPGGKVSVEVSGRCISVIDQGPGMDQAVVNSLSKPGHLGLVITKELLDKLGCSLSALNLPEGGCQMTITYAKET